jgi:AraC family transcriptional regulator
MSGFYTERSMSDLSDLANLDYVGRINRAIDHVTRHLSAPLKLEQLARVAAFSPFHFHRVFKANSASLR